MTTYYLMFVVISVVVGLAFCHQPSYATSTATQIQDPANDPYFETFPCPNPSDIFPCTCTYHDGVFEKKMDMHCGSANFLDENILYDIFHADMPSHYFTHLYLDTTYVSRLSDDVFGDATFEVVYACPRGMYEDECNPNPERNLTYIGSETFMKSNSTLRELHLSFNTELTSFPVETLEQYTELRRIDLLGVPFASFPIIQSPSLDELNLGFAAYDVIPEGCLDGVPNLRMFTHTYSNITSMATGIFSSLPYITTIDMPYSGLVHLERGQFEVNHGWPVEFEFIGNKITDVDIDSFKGVTDGAIVLAYNHIRTLPEDTWRPVLDNGVWIEYIGNALDCACDVAWLVLDPKSYKQLVLGAKCNTNVKLWDLDPSNFENC